MQHGSLGPSGAYVNFEFPAQGGCIIVTVPIPVMESSEASGAKSIDLSVSVEAWRANAKFDPKQWVSIAEAARMHARDYFVISTPAEEKRLYLRAKAHILRACDAGEIRTCIINGKRKLYRESLQAWRLDQQERNLNKIDEDE